MANKTPVDLQHFYNLYFSSQRDFISEVIRLCFIICLSPSRMTRFDSVSDHSHLSFDCGTVGLDGLGLTDQPCIFLLVAGNTLLKFSDNMADFVRLKRKTNQRVKRHAMNYTVYYHFYRVATDFDRCDLQNLVRRHQHLQAYETLNTPPATPSWIVE